MMLDILKGIPPFEPAAGGIPFREGLHGAMEPIHTNRGGVDLREYLQYGPFIMPHVDGRILGVDGLADFLDDRFAFRADTDKLLCKLDGASGVVRFGAPDVACAGVEIGFQF